jgi:hypothetical protein
MLSELTEVIMGVGGVHTMLVSPGCIQVAFWRLLGPPSWGAAYLLVKALALPRRLKHQASAARDLFPYGHQWSHPTKKFNASMSRAGRSQNFYTTTIF